MKRLQKSHSHSISGSQSNVFNASKVRAFNNNLPFSGASSVGREIRLGKTQDYNPATVFYFANFRYDQGLAGPIKKVFEKIRKLKRYFKKGLNPNI